MTDVSKFYSKILKFFIVIALLFLLFVISILFGGLLYWALFGIHEMGHWIMAFFLNLIFDGKITGFYFSEWANVPIPNQIYQIFTLSAPVRTRVAGTYPLTGLGGILSATLFAFYIAWSLRKSVKLSHGIFFYSIPIIVFLDELLRNILCGYDGSILISNPICPEIIKWVQNLTPLFLTLPIFYLLISIVDPKRFISKIS